MKSVNLEYDTLVRWADGTNESLTKHLTFQVYFFILSYRLRALEILQKTFVLLAQQTSVLYSRLTDLWKA